MEERGSCGWSKNREGARSDQTPFSLQRALNASSAPGPGLDPRGIVVDPKMERHSDGKDKYTRASDNQPGMGACPKECGHPWLEQDRGSLENPSLCISHLSSLPFPPRWT